jgi:diguanylate cyclase (GGDEF)-like protein/PAS domain S-box-containing protein
MGKFDSRWSRRGPAAMAGESTGAHFRSAFEEAPIGMALVGIGEGDFGRFLMVNESLCRLTGFSRSQLEGSDFQRITHPDDLETDVELMRDLIDGLIPRYQLEKRYIHAKRHSVWVLLSASLVRDDGGAPLHAIRQVQDISAGKQFEGQLEYLADHDPLTGLFNRRRFHRELARQLSYARRYGGGGAVITVDVDQLKVINDTLGHAAGDELLVTVAHLMRDRLRETDTVARLGGDEFGASLPQTARAEAIALADELRRTLRAGAANAVTTSTTIKVSAGIALYDQDMESNEADLLVRADLAMYAAKSAGGDRSVVYDPGLAEPKGRPPSWAGRIRQALTDGTFELYTQPIAGVSDREIALREVLLRLPGDNGELILPSAFIYTAERFGFIRELDRWVIDRSLHAMSELSLGTVSINLSGASVTDPDLAQYVEGQTRRYGVEASELVFEITETAAIANMQSARECLSSLSGIGCRIALDDFGAGFGSFYHLKHLQLDFIKIDGEFVRTLRASKTDQLLITAMVDIAHGLHQKTVAEHVEDEETLNILRRLNVDYAQGNHIAEPAPITEGRRLPASQHSA